jgi:hypothetical protein
MFETCFYFPMIDCDRSFFLARSNRFPREPSRAPCGLEVVAADQTIDIQDLADEVQARLNPAFESPRLDLVERHASARDLGLGESEGSCDWQSQSLDPGDEPFSFLS